MDDVAELTKIVTSNMLKLDIEGTYSKYFFFFILFLLDFQPMQVLTPKRPTTKILHLISELDHESYPFKLECKFVGQKQKIMLSSPHVLENKTNINISVYVQSSNEHWTKLNGSKSVDNPFEQNTKLTEIAPGKIYYLPLGLTKDAKLYLKPKDIK